MLEANASQASLPKDAGDAHLARFDKFRNANGATPTAQLREKMQRTMQDTCAVYRTGPVLEEGVAAHGQALGRSARHARHRPLA